MSEKEKFYRVSAKHEIRVSYLIPRNLIQVPQGLSEEEEFWEQENQVLELICGKDILTSDYGKGVEFDEDYLHSTGIQVFVDDVDGDPSPTLCPRTTADWDIVPPRKIKPPLSDKF